MLRILIGIGAALGGVAAFQLSTLTGVAFAVPLLKGVVIGAVLGFFFWLALRIFLETEL